MADRNNKQGEHIAVLLKEAVEALQVEEGDVIVDATLGNGGHTLELLKKVGEKGKVIAIDLDKEAVVHFQNKIKDNFPELENRLILVSDNFKNIKNILAELYAGGGIKSDKVNGILADLGWRIEQIQDERYGMSFKKRAELNMQLSGSKKKYFTAKKIVNQWSEKKLAHIFKEFGEEREARRIASAIIRERKTKEIIFTDRLAEIVTKAKRFNKERKIHPATKTFQALRMVVNDELNNLEVFLKEAVKVLKKNGRLVVISFHSLEDSIVKKFFRENARGCVCPKNFPICVCHHKALLKNISNNKVITVSKKEMEVNYRSRSARLRVAEKRL